MIATVDLESAERIVLGRIINIQLTSLKLLRNRDTSDDITLLCAQNGLAEIDLNKSLDTKILMWENLKTNPQSFIALDDEQLSIIKHILTTCIDDNNIGKRMIWRKLNINEFFYYHPN